MRDGLSRIFRFLWRSLERNVRGGENRISKVLAIMDDGKTGAPCGACRELMVQLMPKQYRDVEIMMDYQTGRIVTMGELTPEWWI